MPRIRRDLYDTILEVARIAAELPGFTMYNLATGGRSPALSFTELDRLGYSAIVSPTVALYPTVAAIRESAAQLRGTGSDAHLGALGLSPAELFDIVGMRSWLNRDEQVHAARATN